MAPYKKPIITNQNLLSGLFPAIVGPVVGLVKWGTPVIFAIAAIKKDNFIDSTHTSALTARKDFGFA